MVNDAALTWSERAMERNLSADDVSQVGRHSEPLRRRRKVVGVLAWAAFAFLWCLVLRRDAHRFLPKLELPLATLVLVAVSTTWWVEHNLRIFQRKGPRQGLPSHDREWHTDTLGRPLHIAPLAWQSSAVKVVLRDGVKYYEVDQ